MVQGSLHSDRFPTGDTEDLLAGFVHKSGALHRTTEEPVKQSKVGMGRARYQVHFCYTLPIPTHLLLIAHSLLLATHNDILKFIELTLHVL